MEFLLQWLDELDDFVGIVAAQAERVRRLCQACLVLLISFSVLAAGAALAMAKPLLAPLLAGMLLVALLYRRQLQSGETAVVTANG